MAVYSINDIEKLSGVKAHTIRIWEKRYNILANRRTETNIRYYLDEDLELILNIAHLNKKGIKISKLATMTPEEIKQKIADSCEVDVIFENHIDGLMLSMFELNEYKFLKLLNHHIREIGFEKTMDDVIYPMLDKLSVMWIAGSVKGVHENFINNIIRRKLSVEIDKLDFAPNDNATRFLIFLPEYEAHELSLLFVYYLLKKYGANTLYLGTQISLPDVKDAVEIFKPDYIFTLFNDSFSESPLQPYISELAQIQHHGRILISGYQTVQQKLELPVNAEIVYSLNDIKKYLELPVRGY
ncbi:MAG: MerR family transcriptional regulator [Saprospiraceae bacterium]|nr:MerR family transcriptional regulator [Saprospiraceae bacterium]MBL0084340.1 MerR family transcriptional regulator [Saprospiraceae bacterium]